MTKWYGSVENRLMENRNLDAELKEGMDITEYLWSDRICYYITKVNSQKDIMVKRYYVCADHEKEGGMGHQNWLYFKTQKEENEYLKKYFPDHQYNDTEEKDEENWVYRYNHWYIKSVNEYTGKINYYRKNGISFGVRNYYYDWEF